VLSQSTELFQVRAAADDIFITSDKLLASADFLSGIYRNLAAERPVEQWYVFLFGGIALALLVLRAVIARAISAAELAEKEAAREQADEAAQRNQQAILNLLDEIEGLKEGDLTVQASVGEEMTGAIGDAFNDAIDALRSLVTTINETSVQVSSAAQQTQATAMHLAEASDHQAHQITAASAAVNEMAVSIDQVSQNAAESARVAQQSVDLALRGAQTVKATIEQMDLIREQIQETSKRIKRLGESSQEIGNIVELINDIADQTNILALNASIQAAMAGESGRGFAVVADEVQRLAERSGNATKQIEALVRTIQTDTNEAVISMEHSTAGVVAGARQAEEAGDALHEIENVSKQLAGLIQNISEASRQQANAAANISDTMTVIQEITSQTSAGTNETATSIGNLADLANELRSSVAGFKLPDVE
jgi:twitching motility protein PilJ